MFGVEIVTLILAAMAFAFVANLRAARWRTLALVYAGAAPGRGDRPSVASN